VLAGETRSSFPPELAFDAKAVITAIQEFLRNRLAEAGLDCYVLGLSGGIDSAVSAALAVRAVGPDRLITVKMPASSSVPASRLDAERVEEALGIPAQQRLLVEIAPVLDGWRQALRDEPSPLRIGNVAARSRMLVLWDLASKHRGIVLGTENRTENLLGYFTIYGDAGSAVEPITSLYKTQIWALAAHLGLPEQVISKPPTADLWPGQTDEEELGVRYAEADQVLYWHVDHGLAPDQVTSRTGLPPEVVSRVLDRYRATEFKRAIPYRLSRAAGE
jgi:NAD+ synthase